MSVLQRLDKKGRYDLLQFDSNTTILAAVSRVKVFKMQPRSKLSKTSSAFRLLIPGGKWLYSWSPLGTKCTVLFWRAVWLRRRFSDQINVKTIRSRQKQFVSLAAGRRQIKGNLCRAVKANCRHEDRIFSFNHRKIKRRNSFKILSLSVPSHAKKTL